MEIYTLTMAVIAQYILILGQIKAQTGTKILFWEFEGSKWLLIGKGIIQPEGITEWCFEVAEDRVVLFDGKGTVIAFIKHDKLIWIPEQHTEIFERIVQSLHEIVRFFEL